MDRELRAGVQSIVRQAIAAVLPDEAVRRALASFTLGPGRVLLVAVGKAAWQMARAALEVLPRVDGGAVITKYGHAQGALPGVTCYEPGTRCRTKTPLPPPAPRWR